MVRVSFSIPVIIGMLHILVTQQHQRSALRQKYPRVSTTIRHHIVQRFRAEKLL